MQNGWIERLFSRFAALYGAAFGRQWEGTNLTEVKAVWTEKLGGFNAQQIGEALKACDDRPYSPNLPEFVVLCRDAARRDGTRTPALPVPQLSAEEREARGRQLDAAASKPAKYDYRDWCKELKRRYLAGEHLLPIQISMASKAMGEVWERGACKPVDEQPV